MLLGMRQARCVAEICPCHAERLGLACHAPGKFSFRARQMFGNDGSHVVGGFGDQRKHGIFDPDGGALAEAEFRRRTSRRHAADLHAGIHRDPAFFEFLKRR